MKMVTQKLTLDRPATYQIKVPGRLDEGWSEWGGEMTVTVECEEDGRPITTLTGAVDQAALQGLLRRLYSLGLPLISVIWLQRGSEDVPGPSKRAWAKQACLGQASVPRPSKRA